jgi:glyoxylase-like metal-dependent hydrolase (beta-lactamase superfamily II)
LIKNKVDKTPKSNKLLGKIILIFGLLMIKKNKWKAFEVDIILDENYDLSKFGISGKIIKSPGHTAGSISLLLNNGYLFCGDLFMNILGPEVSLLADDFKELNKSSKKILNENIKLIYPGHGSSFKVDKVR